MFASFVASIIFSSATRSCIMPKSFLQYVLYIHQSPALIFSPYFFKVASGIDRTMHASPSNRGVFKYLFGKSSDIEEDGLLRIVLALHCNRLVASHIYLGKPSYESSS